MFVMRADSPARNRFVACLFGAITVFAFSAGARAASFSDYKNRVSQAALALQRLTTHDSYAENLQDREQTIYSTIARVQKLLPQKETVLFGGENVEVDNTWLHESLAQYQKVSADHPATTALFHQVAERLNAIVECLNAMKEGKDSADKDQSKARLAEILRRPEYDKSAAQESAIERLWNAFVRWLSKLFPEVKPIQPGTGRALSGVAQVVVIGIALALLAFLIWKFVPRYLRNRGRKKVKREARIVLGERLEPDQTAADLLEQAEGLARAGDLRGAIRKAYIALLCELGDRKVISLAQHKTNRDYLQSVRQRPSLYQSMRGLTSSFELHWYGFVPAQPEDWTRFRTGCRNAAGTDQ